MSKGLIFLLGNLASTVGNVNSLFLLPKCDRHFFICIEEEEGLIVSLVLRVSSFSCQLLSSYHNFSWQRMIFLSF